MLMRIYAAESCINHDAHSQWELEFTSSDSVPESDSEAVTLVSSIPCNSLAVRAKKSAQITERAEEFFGLTTASRSSGPIRL